MVDGWQIQKNVAILAVSSFMELACLVLLVLRFWAQSLVSRRWRPHDTLFVIGWVSAFGLFLLMVVGVQIAGIGQHSGSPGVSSVHAAFNKCILGMQILWATSTTAFRLSVLDYSTRLSAPHRHFHGLCHVVMALASMWYFNNTASLCVITMCKPIALNQSQEGNNICANEMVVYLLNHASNFLLNSMILVLSIPLVWRRDISTKQIAQIYLAYTLAVLTCSISMARVILYPRYRPTGRDFTYTSAELFLLSNVESLLLTLLFCAPLLKPLTDNMFRSRNISKARRSLRTSLHWYGNERIMEIQPSRTSPRSVHSRSSYAPVFVGSRVTAEDIELGISPTHCGTFYDDSSLYSN